MEAEYTLYLCLLFQLCESRLFQYLLPAVRETCKFESPGGCSQISVKNNSCLDNHGSSDGNETLISRLQVADDVSVAMERVCGNLEQESSRLTQTMGETLFELFMSLKTLKRFREFLPLKLVTWFFSTSAGVECLFIRWVIMERGFYRARAIRFVGGC